MKEGLFSEINPLLWGDVVISTETAGREAREAGITLGERFQFLLIHGLLHLIGYDHEGSESEARRMEIKTEEIMARIEADKKEERRMQIPRLAVNVDHVATVRQARKINEPDPVIAAGMAELAGAEGIIVHLREDRRHIQDRDLFVLKETVKTKLNLEMAAAEEIIRIALKVRPHLVTLVPEKRQELTTEGGLDVRKQQKGLKRNDQTTAQRQDGRQPVCGCRSGTDPGVQGSGGRHHRTAHRSLCRCQNRERGLAAL